MTKDEALQLALKALGSNRRTHHYCEDTWYSCPKHEDGCANDSEGDECNCGADKVNAGIDQAITAIKEALETKEGLLDRKSYLLGLYDQKSRLRLETKDEPVAWMNRHGACKTSLFMEVEAGAKEEYTIPLYTTTPQRTWVKLTDEEMRELEKQFEAERVRTSDEEYLVIYPAAYWQWQRAIEAKLKEKNT